MLKHEYDLEINEIAFLFPEPLPEEYVALKKEIFMRGGPTEPILVQGNSIIDGRSRYRICEDLNLPYQVEELPARNILQYLLEHNRRPLSENQKALIAVYLKRNFREDSRVNQSQAGKRFPYEISPKHAGTMASDRMKVSPRQISYAAKVIDSGNRNFIALVRDGFLSIANAAKIAKNPESIETFINEVETYRHHTEDKIAEHNRLRHEELEATLEKQLKIIKDYYREKLHDLSFEIREKLKLTEDDEKREKLQQLRMNEKARLKKVRDVKMEQARLEHAKSRNALHLQEKAVLLKHVRRYARDISQNTEPHVLAESKYLLYIYWNFELGVLSLDVGIDEVVFERDGIVTFKSGRKVSYEDEVLAEAGTRAYAEELREEFKEQLDSFMGHHRVFRSDSWVKRIFERIQGQFQKMLKANS